MLSKRLAVILSNLLFLAFFAIGNVLGLDAKSNMIKKGSHLEAKLQLFQTEYLVREPIWIEIQITNTGNKDTKFYYMTREKLVITDSKGKTYPCHLFIEYGGQVTIKTGETLEDEFNLLESYYGLPETKLKIRYYLPPEKYSIYYALNKNVKSQTCQFDIHEPKDDEFKAMTLLKEAYDLQVLKKDESYKDKLKELIRKYPESRYYVYALLMSADSLDDWYDLIQRFPNSREAVRAVRSIALTFEKKKDKKGYTQAMNGLIEKYPNTDISKEAEKQLKNLKEEDFK